MAIGFIECYTPSEDVVTCSVKLDFSELADYSYDGVIFYVAYTELGNNGIRQGGRTLSQGFPTEMTLENVVMGSVMYLSSKLPIAPRYDVDTDDFTPTWYDRGVFCLVPEAEDLTIQFYYDGNEVVDATPKQVEEGAKFVGANGVVEEGTLPIHSGAVTPDEIKDESGNIRFIVPMERSVVNGGVSVVVQADAFGNAEKAHVLKGKAFTSKDGYWAIGEMPIYDATTLTAERNENCDTDDGLGFEVFVGTGTFVDDCVYFTVPKSEVGGGASVATCTLVFNLASYYNGGDIAIIYTDANGNTVEGTLPEGNSAYELTVACNSLFYMSGTDLYFSATAGILTQLVEYRAKGVYRVASQPGTYNVLFDNS